MMVNELPNPGCQVGYTFTQLRELLGPVRFAKLTGWLGDQTVECNDSGCGAHGAVVREIDLRAFLNGRLAPPRTEPVRSAQRATTELPKCATRVHGFIGWIRRSSRTRSKR